jgi:hypothetical protein
VTLVAAMVTIVRLIVDPEPAQAVIHCPGFASVVGDMNGACRRHQSLGGARTRREAFPVYPGPLPLAPGNACQLFSASLISAREDRLSP